MGVFRCPCAPVTHDIRNDPLPPPTREAGSNWQISGSPTWTIPTPLTTLRSSNRGRASGGKPPALVESWASFGWQAICSAGISHPARPQGLAFQFRMSVIGPGVDGGAGVAIRKRPPSGVTTYCCEG
jgi:hypothetical protein